MYKHVFTIGTCTYPIHIHTNRGAKHKASQISAGVVRFCNCATIRCSTGAVERWRCG